MSEAADRLQRYLEDHPKECYSEDLQNGLEALDSLADLLDDEQIANDVQTVAALANENRYRLARLLVEAGGELCVCEVTPPIDISDSVVTHAFSTLVEAGLVENQKDGRWRRYRATTRASALLTILDDSR